MVYNALKLFMEINPDIFDETMQQYKQRKLEYVLCYARVRIINHRPIKGASTFG